MGKRAQQKALAEESVEGVAPKKQRSGLFTSGVVSTTDGRRIALFFSGRQHAGENLKDVLLERAADLAPPIQMCDALRSWPTAWPTAGGGLSTWRSIFPRSAATCWRPWR